MPKSKSKRSLTDSKTPYATAARSHTSMATGTPKKLSSGSSGANLIAPNTSLGQHFLKNPAVVTAIVAKAAIKPTDVVMEIGPGTGNMTLPLLSAAKNVVALEYDSRLIRELLKRLENTPDEHKLRIIHGDAIKLAWPFFDVCVANIPYQISSPLVFKLLAHRPTFRCAVVMFQEEFALRLTARPGESLYCRLSVNTQLLAKVDQLMKVGRNNFRPPPKVESRVVRIEPRNPPPPVNFEEWDGMIRLLFNRKNKTLRSVLMTKSTLKMLDENRKTHLALQNASDKQENKQQKDCNGSDVMNVDEGMDMEMEKTAADVIEEITSMERWSGKRAAKLDLDDFLALLAEFNDRGIHFS